MITVAAADFIYDGLAALDRPPSSGPVASDILGGGGGRPEDGPTESPLIGGGPGGGRITGGGPGGGGPRCGLPPIPGGGPGGGAMPGGGIL